MWAHCMSCQVVVFRFWIKECWLFVRSSRFLVSGGPYFVSSLFSWTLSVVCILPMFAVFALCGFVFSGHPSAIVHVSFVPVQRMHELRSYHYVAWQHAFRLRGHRMKIK